MKIILVEKIKDRSRNKVNSNSAAIVVIYPAAEEATCVVLFTGPLLSQLCLSSSIKGATKAAPVIHLTIRTTFH